MKSFISDRCIKLTTPCTDSCTWTSSLASEKIYIVFSTFQQSQLFGPFGKHGKEKMCYVDVHDTPPPPFHKPWYLYNILHAYVEIWTKLHSFQWFKRNYTKEEAYNAVYPILKLMGNQWEFLQFMLKNREINLRIKIVWRKLSL